VSWQPLNLASPEYAIPPEPPALAGLVYRGKRHVVSGAPESLKTMLCYIIALEAIRAGEGVALIDLEMGPAAARTLLAELGATADELSSFYYVDPKEPPTAADLEALLAAGVTLAIVDAAVGGYALSGLDDNKRQDAERFARMWLDPLWKRGVTTIVVDHVTKNVDGRGRYAIGSERKIGGADVHLGLHVVRRLRRGGCGLVRIDTHKDRPGYLPDVAAELELSSDPDTHAITWAFRPASSGTSDGWKPTLLMERVLEHVRRHPEPTSRSALANVVRGKREYVLQAIDELLAGGQLEIEGGKVVPVPETFPERELLTEGNGNVPRSSPLQGERLSGTTFGGAESDDIPF